MSHSPQNGFIALVSAIIIAALLLIITTTIGMTGIFGRLNILDADSKERNIALAEACADIAILDLSQELVPPPTVTIGSDICSVVSVTVDSPAPGQTTIKTQASVNKAYTNLAVVIDSEDFSIISWNEI